MKAGLLRAPNQLAFEDVPDPTGAPGDIIMRMRAATVCGTDIRIFRGRKTAGIRYPSVIGHEFSGEVVNAPSESGFVPGDRICVNPAVPCGSCSYCKAGAENVCQNLTALGYEYNGAFAEFILIPARALVTGNVYRIPPHLAFEEAALTEPFACVINGQERVSVGLGDAVLILGAGPIGLLHVKLARLSGARLVIVSEPSAARRAASLEAGADVALDPTGTDLPAAIRAATDGLGVDVAIVAIGVPALANQALACVRRRGRVSLFAGFSVGESAPLDVNLIHYGELVVTGASGLGRLHFERALNLIASGRIDVKPLVTHRFDLPSIVEALATAEQGSAIKVAILQS